MAQKENEGTSHVKIRGATQKISWGFLASLALLSLAGCSDNDTTSATTTSCRSRRAATPTSPRLRREAPREQSSFLVSARVLAVKDSAQASVISLQSGWNTFSVPFMNLTTLTADQPR